MQHTQDRPRPLYKGLHHQLNAAVAGAGAAGGRNEIRRWLAPAAVTAAVLLGAASLAACSSVPAAVHRSAHPKTTAVVPSTLTTSVASAVAPCTAQALVAAEGPGASVGTTTFACTGSWAFARVSVGAGEGQLITEDQLFSDSGGAWHEADEPVACRTRAVPSTLKADACAS